MYMCVGVLEAEAEEKEIGWKALEWKCRREQQMLGRSLVRRIGADTAFRYSLSKQATNQNGNSEIFGM